MAGLQGRPWQEHTDAPHGARATRAGTQPRRGTKDRRILARISQRA